MSTPTRRPPSWLRGLLEAAWPGSQGNEVLEELDKAYASLNTRYGGTVVLAWYAAQLLRPATWRLAYELRRIALGTSPSPPNVISPGTGLGLSLLDLKLSLRMLRKQPMLTGVAVVALGLGIPASLSVTHLWRAQFAPIPGEEGERIVGVRHWNTRANRAQRGSLEDFMSWRREITTVASLSAARSVEWNVRSENGWAEPIRGAEMTASAFDVLRVPPLLGRTLIPDDELSGAENVAVLSFDLWMSRFGGDPDIVGQTTRVSGIPHTVVGVMPQGFLFPRSHRLWLPLRVAETPIPGSQGFLWTFGRLADGVSLELARLEVAAVGERLATDNPETHAQLRGEVVSMPVLAWGSSADPTDDPVMRIGELLPLLLLMVMCGNVGIMILARSASRAGEFATRAALGASRFRIVAQLFGESLVLALLATGFGLFVADWAIVRYELLEGSQYPYWTDLSLGPRTVLLSLGLAGFSAVVASVIPALKATGSRARLGMGTRGSTMRFGHGSTALIVTEVALAVAALSAGVGWSIASLSAAKGDMGIDLNQYLSARLVVPSAVSAPGASAADSTALGERLQAIQADLRDRLAAEPGVRTVAFARTLPGQGPFRRRVQIVGNEGPLGEGAARVAVATVDNDFFRDMDHPILQGRDFTQGDAPGVGGGQRLPVIVNTTFVEQLLGGRSPIGQSIRYAQDDAGPEYQIVGVVGPLGMNPLDPELDAGVYHAASPGQFHPVGIVLRIDGDPVSFAGRLRAIAAEADPIAMIRDVAPLSDQANRDVTGIQYLSLSAVLLSAVAIFLSAAGLYALMSFTVLQRTGEIGVRTALGARPWGIVSVVGGRAAVQLLTGIVFGMGLAVPLLMILSSRSSLKPEWLPLVVLGTGVATLLVGMVSCLRPTLRGLRIRPIEALRVE